MNNIANSVIFVHFIDLVLDIWNMSNVVIIAMYAASNPQIKWCVFLRHPAVFAATDAAADADARLTMTLTFLVVSYPSD